MTRERITSVSIPIKRGHVGRAVRSADLVCAEANDSITGSTERGIVLMTAILLVERLATSVGCDPCAVLDRMADCFEVKRRYVESLKHCS